MYLRTQPVLGSINPGKAMCNSNLNYMFLLNCKWLWLPGKVGKRVRHFYLLLIAPLHRGLLAALSMPQHLQPPHAQQPDKELEVSTGTKCLAWPGTQGP